MLKALVEKLYIYIRAAIYAKYKQEIGVRSKSKKHINTKGIPSKGPQIDSMQSAGTRLELEGKLREFTELISEKKMRSEKKEMSGSFKSREAP